MTEARKIPSAASPSPISSGCWCPRAFFARLVLRTRAGARGLSRVRRLRRRAMAASFDAIPATPPKELCVPSPLQRRATREEVAKHAIERFVALPLSSPLRDREPPHPRVRGPRDSQTSRDRPQEPPELRMGKPERIEHPHRDDEVRMERLPTGHFARGWRNKTRAW